ALYRFRCKNNTPPEAVPSARGARTELPPHLFPPRLTLHGEKAPQDHSSTGTEENKAAPCRGDREPNLPPRGTEGACNEARATPIKDLEVQTSEGEAQQQHGAGGEGAELGLPRGSPPASWSQALGEGGRGCSKQQKDKIREGSPAVSKQNKNLCVCIEYFSIHTMSDEPDCVSQKLITTMTHALTAIYLDYCNLLYMGLSLKIGNFRCFDESNDSAIQTTTV
ncbi:uncharacterized protein LOC112543021, partial [Python bivittatus]|uniref:Uncharacterized protein LOC112543021 n=1 Tax=Python bivittatus TaxID=176946 RepID=A0A9F5J4N9_PYTBI